MFFSLRVMYRKELFFSGTFQENISADRSKIIRFVLKDFEVDKKKEL